MKMEIKISDNEKITLLTIWGIIATIGDYIYLYWYLITGSHHSVFVLMIFFRLFYGWMISLANLSDTVDDPSLFSKTTKKDGTTEDTSLIIAFFVSVIITVIILYHVLYPWINPWFNSPNSKIKALEEPKNISENEFSQFSEKILTRIEQIDSELGQFKQIINRNRCEHN